MRSAQETLDATFPEMRWRCLSLAADLDRIDRGSASALVKVDARLMRLRDALHVLLSDAPDRAEKVQMIFSDLTPPPSRS